MKTAGYPRPMQARGKGVRIRTIKWDVVRATPMDQQVAFLKWVVNFTKSGTTPLNSTRDFIEWCKVADKAGAF